MGICADQELRKIYLDAWNADNQKDLEKGAQAFLCSLRSRDWSGMQDVSSIPDLLDLDMSDMPGALRHRRRCSCSSTARTRKWLTGLQCRSIFK